MAGAGYKLFNTGDVLTAQQVNEYLMQQTVMVFADASARTTALSGVIAEGMISYLKDTNAVERYDGSTWSAIGAGDIEGVTAGVGISGGGTSGTVTITNSMATAIDAKGDLVAGTGADTFARLAVGANDTVLTADSSTATGLKWAAAGGAGANWTLLNSGGTSLSGAATVTVSGISAKDKIMILYKSASSTNTYPDLGVRLNGDTGNNYYIFGGWINAGASYSAGNFNAEEGSVLSYARIATFGSAADQRASGAFLLTGCNSSGVKVFQSVSGMTAGAGNGQTSYYVGGYYDSSSTISSISMYFTGGTFDNGTVYVYTSA